HYRSGNVLVADADRKRGADLGQLRRDVGQRDVLGDGRAVGPARHLPHDLALGGDVMAVTRDAALDDQAGDPAFRAVRLLLRDRVAADEVLVELAGPAEARLDRAGGLVDVIAVEREA